MILQAQRTAEVGPRVRPIIMDGQGGLETYLRRLPIALFKLAVSKHELCVEIVGTQFDCALQRKRCVVDSIARLQYDSEAEM